MTNFARKEQKGSVGEIDSATAFVDDFKLAEQVGSSIRFPEVSLDFSNDIQLLEAGTAAIPGQADGFRSLCDSLLDYSDMDGDGRTSCVLHVRSCRNTSLIHC